ncbi:hypothetical protein DFQ28_000693 [Apophysomyces sp. BC1034]|nr:hypothetical protein DFQ29_000395 [Apophysomyces sp. BC1021]KAG0183872.1 hypothetical protein DFQ28_000693 [Apophysomyces sp. BC1034]
MANIPTELRNEFRTLFEMQWGFLQSNWPSITQVKRHRTETKDVHDISHVKEILVRRLGYIAVFFFLVVLFGTRDYSGPYHNVEKGLLILYQLVTGSSIAEMGQFIPKSSFYDVYKDFYIHQYADLDKKITSMLECMFSSPKIRIHSAHCSNPTMFKHVTMMIDGHDTQASYPLANRAALYSYKLKRSGFRTQVCIDVNGMILFVSSSAPCRDNNDGTMLTRMHIEKKVHHADCIALDGGYTLFVDKVIENNDLSHANFCYPIRKQRGVELTPKEIEYNKTFGSFRSRIEATFGEIGSTFEWFNN